jgi:hypothetical protein
LLKWRQPDCQESDSIFDLKKTGGAAAARAQFQWLGRCQNSLRSFLAWAAARCCSHGGRPRRCWRRTCESCRRRRRPRRRCGRSDRMRRGSRREGGRAVNGRRCRRWPVHLRSCRNGRWAIHLRPRHNRGRSVRRWPSFRPALHDALIPGGSMGDRRSLPRAPLNRAWRLITLTPTGPLVDAALARPRRRLRGRRRCLRRRDAAPALFGPAPRLRCSSLALLALLPLR